MPARPDAITRLYRVCDPSEALEPDDSRYVNCDDVRGEKLVERYERALRRADPTRPDVKLFAGHRGVGKTSELLRLKRDLENPTSESAAPFKVIFFDVCDTLDPNDLELPDLLVFTAAQVQKQLREAKIRGFKATSVLLQRVWDDLRDLGASEVELKGGEVDAGLASLSVELRNRPSNRSSLRAAIERQSTNLLAAINDLLTTANVSLRKAGFEGLVLIIDGLDKVVRRPIDDGKSNTHQRLFIDRSEQLASLGAHTIYTVPISMIYSTQCAQLEQTFGEHSVPVSMIRLHEPHETTVSPDSPGMNKLQQIIEARCRAADVDPNDVFDTADTSRFVREMTGGHPRHLMMFIQAACDAVDALPITREAAENAVRNYANSLLREIPDEFWPKLRNFNRAQTDIPKDDIHQQMLLLLHVFEYMNTQPWYEVNPVIRTLPKFQATA